MRSARLLAVVVLAVVLALSSAQNAFASVKLYYDSGVQGGYGGSFSYAGVRFSLPSGVNSAHLLDIQYGWGTLTDTNALTIYITGSDHTTPLAAPIPVATSTWLWNTVDVSGSGVVVSGDFYVVVQRTTTVIGSSLAFDNAANVGRSYFGSSLASLIYTYGQNWMIRVDIDPISALPVGGVVIPANMFAVLSPWLAVIGLVGCIGTAVVVAKKLRA